MQLAALSKRAGRSHPLRRNSGRNLTYAVGAPRRFDGIAVAVAELIANEAGDVLERTRLQEEVQEERERAARVLAHIGDGCSSSTATG